MSEAILGLIGVSLTALVAWLGVRATARGERRLVVESAVKSAELLATKDGREPNNSTIAAALISLADLGQTELAIAMLWELWICGKASNETAVLVADKAIESRTGSSSRLAAELLWHQAVCLDSRKASNWPDCVDGRWIPALSPLTKLLLIDAMLRMTFEQAPDEYTIPAITVRLYSIAESDRDPNIGGLAQVLLFMLLPALAKLERTELIHADRVIEVGAVQRLALNPKDWSGGLSGQLLGRTVDTRRWADRVL